MQEIKGESENIIITLCFLRLNEMQNAESKSERIILTLVPLIIWDMSEWMRRRQKRDCKNNHNICCNLIVSKGIMGILKKQV